jgi:hypothetical protein
VALRRPIRKYGHMASMRQVNCSVNWGVEASVQSHLIPGMQALAELNGILAAFTALQRSVQRSSFEAVR